MRKLHLALVLSFIVILAACATIGQKPMTPQRQAIVWMSVYNAEYDDVFNIMVSPTSTPAQKDMARKKKAILVKVWPLIRAYVTVIDKGATPTPADTAAIIDLINKLTAGG